MYIHKLFYRRAMSFKDLVMQGVRNTQISTRHCLCKVLSKFRSLFTMIASGPGPLGHAGGTSFDFLPGWSNLDRPKWSNRFTRYPRVPRNPFPSDGPNNPNNKQNFANIFNGSQQQGCKMPFPKPMRIASSCRSCLNFRKIFHGNDRNNHRNQ